MRADAKFLELRPDRKSRRALFDNECRHATASVRRDEARQHHRGVARLGLRDKNLLAVENPFAGLAIESRGRSDVRRIRAGAGLGNRNRDRVVLPLLELLWRRDGFEHGVAESPLAAMQRYSAPVDFEHHQRMKNSGAAASAESFFGQRDWVWQTFRFREFFGLEFVFVLVVVARIAPANDRLLVRAAQNVLVSRSELEIYHRIIL